MKREGVTLYHLCGMARTQNMSLTSKGQRRQVGATPGLDQRTKPFICNSRQD